jgi:hypothetical protein
MIVVEPVVAPEVPDIPVEDETGGISTLSLIEDATELWIAETMADFDQEWTALVNELQADYPPQISTAFEAAVSPLKTAIDDGTITPAQGGAFLRWLNYNKGVTSIVNDATTSATMTSYLAQWIVEQSGLVPTTPTPAPAPTPPPIVATSPAPPLVPNPAPAPVLPTPTQGQQVITKTVIEVVPQQVQATGSTGPTATQVQAAIGVAFADAMRAQAAAIDAMLPGLKPGQVPQALDQLNQATHVLEDQLAILRATTTGHAPASLSIQITALQAAMKALQSTAATLTSQMAETIPSGLSDDLGKVKTAQKTDETNIKALEDAIPGLAPLATVTALGSSVSALQRQMDLVDPSPLDSAVNAAQGAADGAATAAKDAQDCCDDAHAQLDDDENALGGKSALQKLGQLAGAAYGLLALIGFLETIEAIANLPIVLKAIITDTTTISGWAQTAASTIVADMSWADGFNAQ